MRRPKFFVQANPLVPLVPPFIIGILLGETNITLWLVTAMAVMAIFVYRVNTLAGLCLIACAIGWLDSAVRTATEPDAALYSRESRYSAIVINVAESESARSLTVIMDSINGMVTDQFKTAVYIPSMLPPVRVGDRICVVAQLEPLAFTHDLPDEYDYAKNLRRHGITTTSIVSPDKINVCRRENGMRSWLDDRRNNIADLLMNSALNDEASSLSVAILTGNDDYISDKWRGALSESGIAHILALSGVHVAIIAWVIAIVLFPLTIMQLNKLRWIITIFGLWSFAVLTGMSDSVMRATIMTTVVLVALLLQRRTSVYNILAFAMLVILFVSPTSLYSIGFQLTFAAVAAIVSINPILCGK